jgi:hypothetical protein
MACSHCSSSNQMEFPAELGIHPPNLADAEVAVFVFPRLLICLDCGSSSFMTPMFELKRLQAANVPLA